MGIQWKSLNWTVNADIIIPPLPPVPFEFRHLERAKTPVISVIQLTELFWYLNFGFNLKALPVLAGK